VFLTPKGVEYRVHYRDGLVPGLRWSMSGPLDGPVELFFLFYFIMTGIHICLTHHLGKSERMDDGDSVLGSTAILGAVDTAVLLKRRSDGTRTIRTSQRDGEDLEETVLSYDKETGLISLGSSIAEEQMKAARQSVLDALASGEELTAADVRERVGANHGRTSAALRALLAEGGVTRVGAGKKGDPYKYRLA
jgi:hypothetical protein